MCDKMVNKDWIKSRRSYEYHVDRFRLGASTLYCDRSSSFGTYSYPSCFKNDAEYKVTIDHGESKPEYLILCGECAEGIKEQVRRHGYKMKKQRLTKKDKDNIITYALQ